jgi:hypothetical protein
MRSRERSSSPLEWRRPTLLIVTALLATACGADPGASDNAPSANATTSPSATTSSATASASAAAASPGELPIAMGQEMSAGNYSLSEFPVAISFEIPAFEPPAVWFVCSASEVEQAVCHSSTEDAPAAALTFQIVDNVVAECADQESAQLLDPPVGPSVDELVTAISALEGYEATAPEDITVSGFPGKQFTLTAVRHACGATWATADRITGMGAGEINVLRVVDVDGVRVLIAEAYHPDTPEPDVAALEQVMDSVQIEP